MAVPMNNDPTAEARNSEWPLERDRLQGLADNEVIQQVVGIKRGDHVCALYNHSPYEHLPEVIQYFQDGLAQGERCIYIGDRKADSELLDQVQDAGINVQAELDRGSLMFWSREEWRPPGLLDSIRKAAEVREILDHAFEGGFQGVRFAVEMTWILDPEIPHQALEDWEVAGTRLLSSGPPITALCLYGRNRLSEPAVQAGLRSHPLLLDEDGLRSNEHFSP
jgi:hypothetical protein